MKPDSRKGTLSFMDAITGAHTIYENMAELAPGVWAGGIPPESIPPVGFHSWSKLNDGSGAYIPVVRTFQSRLQLTKDIGKYLGVGIPDNPATQAIYRTIRRLIMAGFIKAGQLGPGGAELDLLSFWQHYNATRKPGFWTPERRRQYNRRTRGRILPEDEE